MSRSRFLFCLRADPRSSTLGAVLLSLSMPLVFGSCVADSVSLRISCNIAPEDDCNYESTGACYLDGAMNIASSRNRYHAVLLVSNGLKPRMRDVPPQSEPNGVAVQELEIEITDSAGRKPNFPSRLPNPFTVKATGDIKPGDDAPVGAELLPSPYVRDLIQMAANGKGLSSVSLSILARGRTWGGVDVESAAWPWSIQLVSGSDVFDDGQCVDPKEDKVCALGQDEWTSTCNPSTVPAKGT